MYNSEDDINLLDTETESFNPNSDSPRVKLAKLIKQKQMLDLINPPQSAPKFDSNLSNNTDNKEVENISLPSESNEKELKDLLDKMKELSKAPNSTIPKNIPTNIVQPSIPTDSYISKLTEAQDRANRMASIMDLGRAMSAASATMVGAKESAIDRPLQAMKENIQALPGQLLSLKEQEKYDPNSQISKQYRSIASKMGFGQETKESSAADIEKLAPQLTNIYTQQQAAIARHQDLMLRLEELGLRKQELKQSKEKQEINKRFDDLNKKLVSEIASSRTTFGTDAKTLQGVQNVKALIEGKDPNDLDNREVYEVAKVLDRILSQGAPTISGSAKLTPDTARGLVSKYMEFISNRRIGAGAGSFINRFSKTLDREEDQAKNRIIQTQGKLLSSYSDLKEKDPDKWNLIMQKHNLPSNILDKKGGEKIQTKQDQKVVEFSKKYNMTYDNALKLLKQRGYNAEE